MTFSIVIATHGDIKWSTLAYERAYPSAKDQGAEVLLAHEQNATRAEVRNALTEKATGDWIITLDADDELAPGYVTAMEGARVRRIYQDKLDPCLLTPQVSYVRKGRKQTPKFWPEVDLKNGNWMVVGTAVPRWLFLEVGGWRTFTGSGVLNEWDDWDLWIRCVQAGAEIEKVHRAVYVAHVSDSSHYARSRKESRLWFEEIRQANGIGG